MPMQMQNRGRLQQTSGRAREMDMDVQHSRRPSEGHAEVLDRRPVRLPDDRRVVKDHRRPRMRRGARENRCHR